LPDAGKTICTFKFGSLTVGPEGEVGAIEYCAKALKIEIEDGKKDLLKLVNCAIVNDADNNNINEKKVKQDLMKNLLDFKINLNTCLGPIKFIFFMCFVTSFFKSNLTVCLA
jgi:hypothetical protein